LREPFGAGLPGRPGVPPLYGMKACNEDFLALLGNVTSHLFKGILPPKKNWGQKDF
jgi:hypothetical protein